MKLTPAQRRMLENIEAGRKPTSGLTGRSAWGGATQTYDALIRHEFIHWSTAELTDKARAALKDHKP